MKAYRVKVDIEVKNKLLNIRNKYGFLDLNHTIKHLLKNEFLATKEDIEKLIQQKETGIPTEIDIKEPQNAPVKKKVPEEAIPIIVPKPNVTEPNIQTVKCPQCQTKFKAEMKGTIKCPKCGLEGRA